jgi:hypothetical protein
MKKNIIENILFVDKNRSLKRVERDKMTKTRLRQNRQEITERDIRMVTDYNAGIKVKEIFKRYSCGASSLYNALNKVIKKEETNV